MLRAPGILRKKTTHDDAFGCQRSVVVSALASINVVNQHWARLVLGSVTVCGRVNHLGM